MYYSHPAYDDYPVVGLNYWQILAFLEWKTKQKQKQLDAQGIKFNVSYELPNEIEWEMAATSEKNKETQATELFTKSYSYLADKSWLTDLNLKLRLVQHIDTVRIHKPELDQLKIYDNTRFNMFSEELLKDEIFRGDFMQDGFFHTTKSDINKLTSAEKKNNLLMCNTDATGICFLGGNVSEWMKESYKENWLPVFTKRQQLLKTLKGADAKIMAELEQYYNQYNDTNGRLVRGSNWFDERFSNKCGKNTAGTNAKVFVDPNKAYSTLGFRYVIHYSAK